MQWKRKFFVWVNILGSTKLDSCKFEEQTYKKNFFFVTAMRITVK